MAAEPSPRRLRVALVAYDVGYRYAVPRALAEVVARLAGEVDFVVVSSHLDPELRPLVDWRRVPARGRSLRRRHAAFFLAAPFVLRRVRADLVQTAGVLVPGRVDLAWVHWCYGGFHEAMGRQAGRGAGFRLARLVSRAVERWCYGRRTRVLAAPSRQTQEELVRLFPGVQAAVCPNGVDGTRFRPSLEARRILRRELGVGEDEVVALFVGNAWERKGLAAAIEGLADAAGRGRAPERLWVLGSGDTARYRILAERCGVAGRVEFFGYRADSERFFQAADVFVLPTRYETFCLAAHEAVAAGLPVVATGAGGIEELLADGEAGILVEPTGEDVGRALGLLAADPELGVRLGEEGRRRVAAFTWDRTAACLLDLYRRLAAP